MPKAKVKAGPKAKVVKAKEISVPAGQVGAILELIVKDKDGKVTERRVMESKSFVQQWLQLLWANMYFLFDTKVSIKDTGGVVRNVYSHYTNFRSNAGSGITTFGVIVGMGTTSLAMDDYAMETPIAHGTGAGQLQYSAMTFGAPADDGTVSQFTLTRDFANGSGGAVTVNEIGLYVKGFDGATKYFLGIRDVIAGGIAVPNGQTLTVNYRIQATV